MNCGCLRAERKRAARTQIETSALGCRWHRGYAKTDASFPVLQARGEGDEEQDGEIRNGED
eukprot:5385300-Pyramimonas_sp.AAC.2